MNEMQPLLFGKCGKIKLRHAHTEKSWHLRAFLTQNYNHMFRLFLHSDSLWLNQG